MPLDPALVDDETRQCRGKYRHATASDARKAAKRMARQNGHKERFNAYRCPHCGSLARPAVTWFGEPLDRPSFDAAVHAARPRP